MTILQMPDRAHRLRVPAPEAAAGASRRTAEIVILPCIRRERLDFDASRGGEAAEAASICA